MKVWSSVKMWPVTVKQQFDIAKAEGIDALGNVWNGPYNALLSTLFPIDTAFLVYPNFKTSSTTGTGYRTSMSYKIRLENKPVFVMQLKREKDLKRSSKRMAADEKLRARLGDLIGNALLPPSFLSISKLFAIGTCPLPILHGVSVFGTKLCFYSITKEGLIEPGTDCAPVSRWNYDILTAEGEAELRRIVDIITTECAQLPQ
jgi:hypothetical protein